MATGPSDRAPRSLELGAARYRAALRWATLRKQGWTGGHVLHRWSWLFPRIIAGAVGGVVAVASAGPPPATPPPSTLGPCIKPEPGPEPIVVIITRSSILLGEEATPVVPLPARETLVASGIDAKYKRHGPDDMFVVPLAEALARVQSANASDRDAGDDRPAEAILVADGATPYRLLVEVLFTLGQSNVGKYHLVVAKKK